MKTLLDFCDSVHKMSQKIEYSGFELDSAWSFLWQTPKRETFFGLCRYDLAKYRVIIKLAKIT